MATVHSNTSYPHAHTDEPPQVLFDDPDADVILRSCDSQTFRVLKLYIMRSSSVLGELIEAVSYTSGAANSASVGIGLPEVQLSDKGTILFFLLTFVFPVPSILPSSLDERMQLLSVAQKYEMSSVIDHIRGSLSLQDPPLIHRENAFLAYSLAQRYGLRHEAIQAARLTLKFTLTIEDDMPGAYLHELWKYHKRVQAQLRLDIPFSVAGTVLSTFKCSQHAATGPPYWVHSYTMSIAENPSVFDPIEFQMSLLRHTTGAVNGVGTPAAWCSSCALIPVETMRTFWKNLAVTVQESMKQAESELSIIGMETSSLSRTGLPVVSFPLPECLDISEADVVVRSSDRINFRVHKAILASSSQIFKDMFSLPQSLNNGAIDGLPVVDITEDAELVRSLITVLYPIPSELPASYDKILALLAVAQKYDMVAVQSTIRGELACRQFPVLVGTQAFRAYAIASSSRLLPELNEAASLTLDYPMTLEHIGGDLRLFERWALRNLANFRKNCTEKLVTCFESYLDALNGPSKVWTVAVDPGAYYFMTNRGGATDRDGCQGSKSQLSTKGTPTLPSWLHDCFAQQIEELKQDFTRPLIKPTKFRAKYLEALRRHAVSGHCTFCLEKHTSLKGEQYCAKLEQAIARARDETLFTSI